MCANRIDVLRSTALPGVLLYRGTGVEHAYPRHWHDELHLCAYSAGAGRLRLRGAAHAIGPGDLIVTPAGEVHENWVEPGQSCSFRSLYLDLSLLRGLARQITGRSGIEFSVREPRLRSPRLQAALLALHAAIEGEETTLEAEASLLALCRALLDLQGSHPAARRLGAEPVAVRRAQDFLRERFANSVSLQELARLTGLSPSYLHRAFSRQTGMPPHAFQVQLRINRARQLLTKGSAPADVAAATGFADQSHLTRHFRRRVGLPPARFALGSRSERTRTQRAPAPTVRGT